MQIDFWLKVEEKLLNIKKITKEQFSDAHREVISKIKFVNGNLILSEKQWKALYLGSGEEKCVYGIIGKDDRIFALELIDENHYLNGRFVNGEYFFQTRAPGIVNQKFDQNAIIGLKFTGLVKAREYVYGFEWTRFQFDMRKNTILLDSLLTWLLRFYFLKEYIDIERRYKDVHERNVMFELRDFNQKGFPLVVIDVRGKLQFVKVGIQPIDVR